jgi:hypothetical protein
MGEGLGDGTRYNGTKRGADQVGRVARAAGECG